MLPGPLLMSRPNGEEVVPKRLPPEGRALQMAVETIALFHRARGWRRARLDEQLAVLEGEATDYRIRRGFAYLLAKGFATFEAISPLEPAELRRRLFQSAAEQLPGTATSSRLVAELSHQLGVELEREVSTEEIRAGLHADLKENAILTHFEEPTPEVLIHRYNLAQAQGILYRAREVVLTAHRNVPGEYKQLFRYLKLFGLMSYLEGDADHGLTITIDGPASLFGNSTRYGLNLAKFLPALLQVSRWNMVAHLLPRRQDAPTAQRFTLDSGCGLVSHYKKGKAYDSMLEQAFADRWSRTKTSWRLEREVDLLPIPGSVMVPDFRLVHPDGRSFLLEIVGYWRPEYLRKKFAQVRKSGRRDLILAVSERLNLEGAGVRLGGLPARLVWFKGKVNPKDVLALLEEVPSGG